MAEETCAHMSAITTVKRDCAAITDPGLKEPLSAHGLARATRRSVCGTEHSLPAHGRAADGLHI